MIHDTSLSKGTKYFISSDIFYYSSIYFLDIFLTALVTLRITNGNLEILGFVISYSFIIRAIAEFFSLKFLNINSNQNRKDLVVFSSVVGGLLIILMGFSYLLWHVLLIYALITIVTAVSYPYRWTIFTSQFSKQSEDKAWAYEDIITSLSLGVLSAALGIVAKLYGLTTVFVFLGLSYIISAIFFYMIKVPKKLHFWFIR